MITDIRFTLFAFLCLFISSCGNLSSTNDVADVEYVAICTEFDGKWSLASPNGKQYYSERFDNCPSVPMNGVFAVLEADGYAAYHFGGNTLKPLKNCTGLSCVGMMKEGLMPICRPNSRIEVVDESGDIQFTLNPIHGKEIVECDTHYSEGLLIVANSDNLFGAIDNNGATVIEPQFIRLSTFRAGYAFAQINEEGDTLTLLINKQGQTVVTFQDNWKLVSSDIVGGQFIVADRENSLYFVSTSAGVTKCPNNVKGIGQINDGLFVFRNEDSYYGLMSYKNFDITLSPGGKYRSMMFLPWSENLIVYDDNAGGFAIIDIDGNKEREWHQYKVMIPLAMKGFKGFIAYDRTHYFFLNKKGEPIKTDYKIWSISFDPTVCTSVVSQHIDYNDISNRVIGMIGDGSLNGIKIGQIANDVYPKTILPRNYCSRKTFDYEDGGFASQHCRIDCQVSTCDNIGMRDELQRGKHEEYRFTPDNEVAEVKLTVIDPLNVREGNVLPSDELWDKCGGTIVKGIVGKGYKLEATTDDVATYAKGIYRLDVSWNHTDGALILRLYKQTSKK